MSKTRRTRRLSGSSQHHPDRVGSSSLSGGLRWGQWHPFEGIDTSRYCLASADSYFNGRCAACGRDRVASIRRRPAPLLLLAGGEMSRRASRSGSRCRHVHPGHSGGAKMWCALSKTYDTIAKEQTGGRRRWRARARRNFPLGRGQFGRRRMLRRIYAGSTALRSSPAVVVSSGAPR